MDPVGLASDANSLNNVRRAAASDPAGSVRDAANEFEAFFTRQLLKSMREAMPRSGLFDGPGRSSYESMLDDQLARQVSGREGGLGDVLAKHLAQYMNDKPAQISLPEGISASSRANMQPGVDPRISMTSLPGALQAAMIPGSPEASTSASAARDQFVSRLWPHARLAQTHTGVPAEFVMGQAALESGWGKGEMRHPDGRSAHNLFGIKASSGWKGDTVDVKTTEYINNKKTQRVETFRSYGSYAESFNDWVQLMKGLPRYAAVLKGSTTAEQFANGLQSAGYATDPKYGEKLIDVIRQTTEIRDRLEGVSQPPILMQSAQAGAS